MQPRVCQVKHDPPRSYGDCIRACLATMLDRDDVPHVFDGRENEQSWYDLRAWLKSIKRTLFIADLAENPFEFMGQNNPDIPYMLFCSSGNCDHAVVCEGNKVIHNPAWYKQKIDGPHSLGVWIVCIIGVCNVE